MHDSKNMTSTERDIWVYVYRKGWLAAISYHVSNVTALVVTAEHAPAVSVSSPPLTQHLYPMWRYKDEVKNRRESFDNFCPKTYVWGLPYIVRNLFVILLFMRFCMKHQSTFDTRAHCGSLRAGDACLMLPLPPTGSLELLLTGSTGSRKILLVRFNCGRQTVYPIAFQFLFACLFLCFNRPAHSLDALYQMYMWNKSDLATI